MAVDNAQRQLDSRVRATSPVERARLQARLHDDAIRIVWAAADAAAPMTELERGRFLLRRLYPDLDGDRLEAIMRQLESEWQAGSWTGFRRPDPAAE